MPRSVPLARSAVQAAVVATALVAAPAAANPATPVPKGSQPGVESPVPKTSQVYTLQPGAESPVPKTSQSIAVLGSPAPKASESGGLEPGSPVPKTSRPIAVLGAPAPKPGPLEPGSPVPKTSQPGALDLSAPLTVERAVDVALAGSPGLRAAAHRVRGQELLAEAERKPAGPMLSVDVWQVPLARPWAWNESPMVMLALRQPIPVAGLLRRRAAARRHMADAESADREAQAQALALAVRHAFIDYEAISARHVLHLEHREVSERVLELARARQTVSGTLLDIARAETEAARAHAEVATDATTIDAAKIRLNSLLARPPDAPLGPPVPLPAETADADAVALIARAREGRPEQRAAAARRDAAAMDLQAARREAALPSADVGLAYFPATKVMQYHGYGVLVNVSLPWFSAQGRKRRDAQAELAAAAEDDLAEARLQIGREVAEALAAAQSAARRWQTLRGAALPASERAREVALSGYEVGRADLLAMLSAEGAYVEITLELIDAKAALDHALAELERASGAPLPRTPLVPGAAHGGRR